jgi:hypothetical protein
MRGSFAKILYSIILTASISVITGLIFRDNFWYVVTLATIFQVTGFLVLNQIYTNRLMQSLEAIKADQLREQNRNYVNVVCPCNQKNIQFVDIRFDVKPQYMCDKCDSEISCEPSVKTFTVTNPVYFGKDNE